MLLPRVEFMNFSMHSSILARWFHRPAGFLSRESSGAEPGREVQDCSCAGRLPSTGWSAIFRVSSFNSSERIALLGYISCISCAALVGSTFFAGAASAAGTSSQHQSWTKKLETPGGTFAGPVVLEIDPEAAHPGDTTRQHEQWARKMKSPGGTLSGSLDIAFKGTETKNDEEQSSSHPMHQIIRLFPPTGELEGGL